jgi:EAL domain-containing protein (putative c-di-GMP-specific phosphodiesterase class I)
MLRGEDLNMLEEYVGVHPSSIVVELTEHSEITDEDLKQMKSDYERIGIETAVDDYGTGYSNVTNLLRYAPDYVKIDRELLSGIEDSPQKQHFVRDIIEFSHNNGIKALAEGIETRDELKTVVTLGVDLIQGYYIGMPAKEMVQSINSLVVDEIHRFASLKQQGL